jgi:acyl-CoA thioesterase-1
MLSWLFAAIKCTRNFSTCYVIALLIGSTITLVEPVYSQPDKTIVVLGDSLSASYGIDTKRGWVSLLEQKLKAEKLPYQVVNASISGETTSGGLSRIDSILQTQRPGLLILELGANDGLRGLPIKEMKSNLTSMINKAQAQQAKVLLVGMRLPPSYGKRYSEAFFAAFAEVAKASNVALMPFFLAPIATNKTNFFQKDRLHPTAAAQPLLLEALWPYLQPLLTAKKSRQDH